MKGSVAVRKPVQTVTLDTSGGNITTSAWKQLLTAALNLRACSEIEVFNPSGSSVQIAIGGAGSEVAYPFTILPGGTPGPVPFEIPGGQRISCKAIDANITSGLFVINFYG